MKRLLGALAVLFVLAACGSSSSGNVVSAEAYTNSVCGALNPWVSDLVARSKALAPGPTGPATQRKQQIRTYIGAAAGDTQVAIGRLKGAGSPNISGGSAVATEIVGALQQVEATYARAGRQAAALPTSSVSAFQNGLVGIVESVNKSDANVLKRLGVIRRPALKQAAAKAPACRQLRTAG